MNNEGSENWEYHQKLEAMLPAGKNWPQQKMMRPLPRKSALGPSLSSIQERASCLWPNSAKTGRRRESWSGEMVRSVVSATMLEYVRTSS